MYHILLRFYNPNRAIEDHTRKDVDLKIIDIF